MASQSDITREDLYFLLASTGAILPAATKIPEADLKKRIEQAFDTSQEIKTLFNATQVDPKKLVAWSKDRSIYKATRRGNFLENVYNTMLQPKKGYRSQKQETFQEMRQTLDCIAYALDSGKRDILLLPPPDRIKGTIFIRILNVYGAKGDTPLLFLAYKELSSASDTMATELGEFNSDSDLRITLSISTLERYAWMTLLRKNKKRLAPGIQDQLELQHDGKSRIYASFMVPLSPLNMESIGHLTKDTYCDVCQKKGSSVCASCRSARYCGKECQKTDWPKHKAACETVRGASEWRRFTPSDLPKNFPFQGMINFRDPLHRTPGLLNASGRESLQYGKLFLVKFQLALSAPQSSHMLMYDRTRGFAMQWWHSSDPQLFDEATKIIGGRGKFYRWLRRISDTQFEICLEKGPREDPPW